MSHNAGVHDVAGSRGGLGNDDWNAMEDQVVHYPAFQNKINKLNYNGTQNPGNSMYVLLAVVGPSSH
jgi:hypothetical protein